MKYIRPIRQSDYAELLNIAEASGVGFTSLPVNESLLKKKINRSEHSFRTEVHAPGDQGYLFVMVDSQTDQVLGTAGIEASVGSQDPFYHYHLGKVVHASNELNVHNPIDILTLCNDYTGVTEVCTLYLHDFAREGRNGRFLSTFRFLFMAEHHQRFSDRIIAEMRGVSDQHGRSPFWEWLEEHFFKVDFPTADYLTGIGQKQFIAELMPKYPIYVSLLSKEAQAVIGQVHDKTRPALRMLQSEGFSCRGYVDIFDAGPTVEAQLQHVRTAQMSRKLPVKIGDPQSQEPFLIINTKIADFRAIQQPVREQDEYLIISEQSAQVLEVKEGDLVRFVPTKFRGIRL